MVSLWTFFADIITPNRSDSTLWELKNRILRRSGISIGKQVAIGRGFQVLQNRGLFLDDFVSIGHNVHIYNFSEVRIGKFTMVAGETMISNGAHDTESYLPFSAALEIGSGCWIGSGARLVGAGLRVGQNSIVGAGSLVRVDVAVNSIVAGVPARFIRFRTPAVRVWSFRDIFYDPETFTIPPL